jgi:hypothetical protein
MNDFAGNSSEPDTTGIGLFGGLMMIGEVGFALAAKRAPVLRGIEPQAEAFFGDIILDKPRRDWHIEGIA